MAGLSRMCSQTLRQAGETIGTCWYTGPFRHDARGLNVCEELSQRYVGEKGKPLLYWARERDA